MSVNTRPSVLDKKLLEKARDCIHVRSEEIPAATVRGYDFSQGINMHNIMDSYMTSAFQATNLAIAIKKINEMLDCREQPVPESVTEKTFLYPEGKKKRNCTIFMGHTSNLISSGMREIQRFIVQNDLIDCIVTTCGAIEEDIMKCLRPFYMGSFTLDGKMLRSRGVNRTGNMMVPNDNYIEFEDWLLPILDQMLKEQEENGINWTPSRFIRRLGLEIKNEESVLYWAARNNIPVFCPAITDGAIGDILFYHANINKPTLRLDVVEDITHMNAIAIESVNTGAILLGGGMVKHHILNANSFRNGCDYAVYINTAHDFDGSDAGADPDEAVSWGKIKSKSAAVKVHCEFTIVFPLVVAETFARRVHNHNNNIVKSE